MILSFKESIIGTGLYVRSDKCAILADRRSGNRWYKSKTDAPPIVEFNGELVNVLQRNECYKYLGKPLSVAGERPTHVTEIYDKYCELLDNIVTIDLPIPIKIEALEVIAMSKISHHFANIDINEDSLKLFDNAIYRALRKNIYYPTLSHSKDFLPTKNQRRFGSKKTVTRIPVIQSHSPYQYVKP